MSRSALFILSFIGGLGFIFVAFLIYTTGLVFLPQALVVVIAVVLALIGFILLYVSISSICKFREGNLPRERELSLINNPKGQQSFVAWEGDCYKVGQLDSDPPTLMQRFVDFLNLNPRAGRLS